jgi:hypothetical protein
VRPDQSREKETLQRFALRFQADVDIVKASLCFREVSGGALSFAFTPSTRQGVVDDIGGIGPNHAL